MQTHPPSAEGIVLVDFDGTIVTWGALDKPVLLPFAGRALRKLKKRGYKIGIFTSRLSPSWHVAEGRDPTWGPIEQKKIIERFLEKRRLPFDFITAEKVPSVLILDDKAMRVNTERALDQAVDDFEMAGDLAL